MEQKEKNPSTEQQTKVRDSYFEDIIFQDEEGEYRYNCDKDKYEYYPDWLGNVESEENFWMSV